MIIRKNNSEFNKKIENKFDKKVVTYVKNFKEFYIAENYHQDYYEKNFIRYLMYKKKAVKERKHWKKFGDEKDILY